MSDLLHDLRPGSWARIRKLRVSAILAASLAASPAMAQWCDCGGPPVRYERETILVPRTRLVPRTIYVPRTRLVPRTVYVPRPAFDARGYPAGYRYGDATYVPPGISYPCLMGTVGCDSSAVGPLEN